MKKLIPIALLAALSGVQLVSVAQTAHVHEHQAIQETAAVDMKAKREEMQKKMQGMHGQMHAQMGSHDHGSMKGMPNTDAEMQKRMQSMRDQMAK